MQDALTTLVEATTVLGVVYLVVEFCWGFYDRFMARTPVSSTIPSRVLPQAKSAEAFSIPVPSRSRSQMETVSVLSAE